MTRLNKEVEATRIEDTKVDKENGEKVTQPNKTANIQFSSTNIKQESSERKLHHIVNGKNEINERKEESASTLSRDTKTFDTRNFNMSSISQNSTSPFSNADKRKAVGRIGKALDVGKMKERFASAEQVRIYVTEEKQ